MSNLHHVCTKRACFRFGDGAQTLIGLTESYNINQIRQQITSANFNNLGSGHNIQAALNYVQQNLFTTVSNFSKTPFLTVSHPFACHLLLVLFSSNIQLPVMNMCMTEAQTRRQRQLFALC